MFLLRAVAAVARNNVPSRGLGGLLTHLQGGRWAPGPLPLTGVGTEARKAVAGLGVLHRPGREAQWDSEAGSALQGSLSHGWWSLSFPGHREWPWRFK